MLVEIFVIVLGIIVITPFVIIVINQIKEMKEINKEFKK